jgi:hypothetical protein
MTGFDKLGWFAAGAFAMAAVGGFALSYKPTPVAPASVAATLTPAPATEHATLQQQAECKAVAEKYFDWYMSDEGVGATSLGEVGNVISHYNMKLGVCFAQLHLQERHNSLHQRYVLNDAVADRAYAGYDWNNYEKKQAWEVRPSTCWFADYAGSTKYCNSDEEFFAGIHSLMAD